MSHEPAALQRTLAASAWYGALPDGVRQAMVQRSSLLHLSSGQHLFHQGDLPRAWYGVLRGALLLPTLLEDGREHIMALMEAGNWVGESALIGMQPYLHGAVAQGRVELLALPREAFDELMGDAAFARAVAELVTWRYRLLFAALGDTALRSTRARIARRLLLLARGDVGVTIPPRRRIPVSQQALASMLGVTRQTLNIELKRLAREGLLRLGYGGVEVLSEDALQAIAAAPDGR